MGWWVMRFDSLSFVIGNHGDYGPVRDVVSYLIGRIAGTAGERWKTLRNVAVATFTTVSTLLRKLVVDITPRQAGGTPTPENPLLISGWTGAGITVIGKNLFDVDNAIVYSRSINDNTGKYVPASTSRSYAIPCLPATTYTISCDNLNITIFRICYIEDISIPDSGSLDAYGIQIATASGNLTITTGANATYLVVQINAAVIAESAGKVQIEFGSVATEYTPFNSASEVHSVSWQSEAGTVYGGTLTDNGDGTWTLKVRPYYASYNGEMLVGPWVSSMDVYVEGATPTAGAQVVDLGGAETEYILTAESVLALIGQNNIFADTGSINTITFRTH